jgi:5-methylcytosine-specific restriction endonuclease McrA
MRNRLFDDRPAVVTVCACGAQMASGWGRRRRSCVDCQRARAERERIRRSADPITPEARAAVIVRDGYECRYCGRAVRERAGSKFSRPDDTLHIDHVVPMCRGGTSTVGNLVVACGACNVAKGGRLRG